MSIFLFLIPNSKRALDSLNVEEHNALKTLAEDKTKADKGNAVVIQDIETYREKILELLTADGKFTKLSSDETIKRERSLQVYLRRLYNKKTL